MLENSNTFFLNSFFMNSYEKTYIVVRGILVGTLGLILTVIATNLINIVSWIIHWILFGWLVDWVLDYESGTILGFVAVIVHVVHSILTNGIYGLVTASVSYFLVCIGIGEVDKEREEYRFKLKAGFVICLLFSAILSCLYVDSIYNAIFPLLGLNNIEWIEWLHSVCCFNEQADSFFVYGFYIGIIAGVICPFIFYKYEDKKKDSASN